MWALTIKTFIKALYLNFFGQNQKRKTLMCVLETWVVLQFLGLWSLGLEFFNQFYMHFISIVCAFMKILHTTGQSLHYFLKLVKFGFKTVEYWGDLVIRHFTAFLMSWGWIFLLRRDQCHSLFYTFSHFLVTFLLAYINQNTSTSVRHAVLRVSVERTLYY